MSARTYVLAGGAFAVGTSTYVVSGVLPDVSVDLGVSIAAAGQLVTAFALSYAVAAPLLATLAARWDRRTLLLAALTVAGLGNAVCALTTTYPWLLVGRVVAALGAAAYTPAATLFATALLPAAARGRAVARVFGGLAFALVLGVPAGYLLAGAVGYRGVFGLVAAVCAVFAGAVWLGLPRMAAPPAVGLRARLAVAAEGRALTALAISVLAVLAAMSVYAYMVPLLAATNGARGLAVSMLLGVYGLGAILGTVLGGRITDRLGSLRTLLVVMVGFIVMLGSWPWTTATVPAAGLALFVWSIFTWAFNPPMQGLLLDLSPGTGGLLLSLNASAIFLGAGLSGVVGGVVIDTLGVAALPPVAGTLGILALVLLLMLRRAGLPATPADDGRVAPAGPAAIKGET